MSFLIRFFDNFIQKETLAQVFSCEFCQIIKNTFLFSAPLVATSFLVDTKQIYPRSRGNNWTVTVVGGWTVDVITWFHFCIPFVRYYFYYFLIFL